MRPTSDLPPIEPLAVRFSQACQISGISKSELYRRAARGEVEILKAGRSSLVLLASLQKLVAGLPRK